MKRNDIVSIFLIIFFLVFLFLANNIFEVKSENQLELTNALIAFASLSLALITILINYWNRAEAQRQTLYQNQLKAFMRLFEINMLLADMVSDLQNEHSPATLLMVNDHVSTYKKLIRENWLIFPEKITGLLLNSIEKYQEIINSRFGSAETESIASLSGQYQRLVVNVLEEMRTALGIQVLHENTIELLNKMK
jgi:hypothetical protein